MKQNWQLINPEPLIEAETGSVNKRPESLDGKAVLLYWNGKPNGDLFLNYIGELLKERINNINIIKAWESSPSTKHTDPNAEASRKTAEILAGLKPDIVIGAQGDCSGTTMWMIIDLLNLERLGIPTVGIITSPFIDNANTIPKSEGFNEACIVEISHPIGMLPESDIKEKAVNAFDDILKAATEWRPSVNIGNKIKPYPSDAFNFSGNIADINNLFLNNKWSIGLPILPPSVEQVKEILKGTVRKADEILGKVPPNMGILTVELAAVFAAMAGCRPDYMPLLIAALEAFFDPKANWRLALSGTGTSQLLVIVNGPVVNKLNIGCGQGAAGKGFHANASIGYALNLIAFVAGGSRPPSFDRSTLGSPSDFVCWVFGENEKELPQNWNEFHVDQGFNKPDSVVTVMASYPPVENMDHWSASVEEHIRWWSYIISPLQNMGGPSVPVIIEQNPIIALGPEHANLIHQAEWTKEDFCKACWENTRIPLSAWPSACGRERMEEIFGTLTDDSLIPITLKPEQFKIVIAGGDGKQSHYFAPLPGSFPVSKSIMG